MTLDRRQRHLLFEGLKSAFPTIGELQRFLDFQFDIKLADITNQGNREDNIYGVIQWFESEGLVDDLAEAACKIKPRNPELIETAIAILPRGRIHGRGAQLGEPGNNIEQADIFEEWTHAFQDLEREVREQSQRAKFEHIFAIIRPVLSMHQSANLPALEEVVDAALWLWDELYEEVRETVIQCLVWADQSGGRKWMRERFRNGRTKEKERRLLRDPRLREIAPDLPHWYDWPPIQRDNSLDENPDIKRWLERHDLSTNPFGPRIADMDPLFLTSHAFPSQWDFIIVRRSSSISASDDYDRAAAALMLRHALQSSVPQDHFLVQQTLPLTNIRQNTSTIACMRAVARVVGETWITFLTLNPSALLDLPKADQMGLAELLFWAARSRETLHLLLDRAGLKEDSEGKALLRRLDLAIGGERSRLRPSADKIVSWLRIRPPGLGHTYFVVECPAELSPASSQAQVARLIGLTSIAIRAGVSFKIYHSLADTDLSGNIDRVSLSWERDHLRHMLGRRIYLASKNRLQTFGELFGPEPFQDADGLLVQHAHGSLGKMLELADAVIHEHIRRHDPADHYLEPSDLMTVLERNGRAP